MMGHESKMPCFSVGVVSVTNTLRQRFQLHLSAEEAEHFVETDLVAKSFGSYYTRLYVLLHNQARLNNLADVLSDMTPSSIALKAYTKEGLFINHFPPPCYVAT